LKPKNPAKIYKKGVTQAFYHKQSTQETKDTSSAAGLHQYELEEIKLEYSPKEIIKIVTELVSDFEDCKDHCKKALEETEDAKTESRKVQLQKHYNMTCNNQKYFK